MNSASTERDAPDIKNVDVLLLDIEGTICSVSFVKVNEDLKSGDTSLRAIPEKGSDIDLLIDAICQNFISWTRQDKKYTILKTIQGQIYEEGFLRGILKANFFDDVIPAIKTAFERGIKICIYSSGSVEAQKLFFAHTQEGDLSPFIHAYFDTNSGLKQESRSYSNICRSLNVHPGRVLFLTDVEKEAYAAAEAHVRSCLVIRPGNAPLSDKARRDFSLISSFDQIL